MIQKFQIKNLRNAEYFQFISSVHDILVKKGADNENFACLHEELGLMLKTAEKAMALEKKNDKVREKNEADRYRDRLHSKLFNYLKSILYDEKDLRFDDAQIVMRVMKEAGNPTQLAENAQSAMMTALGNKLEPVHQQLAAIGAQTIADDMMEANRKFIAIEIEYRQMLAAQKLDDTTVSMNTVRKQSYPVYRALVNAINGLYGIPSQKEAYLELVTDMNVLVARYDALLAARKKEKKEEKSEN